MDFRLLKAFLFLMIVTFRIEDYNHLVQKFTIPSMKVRFGSFSSSYSSLVFALAVLVSNCPSLFRLKDS